MSALLKILAALRTGTSTASELSQPTDDYADLVARLQSMCFGGAAGGPPSAWAWEGGASEEEQRTASTGSVSRFESAGSAQTQLRPGPLGGPHQPAAGSPPQ